MRNVLSPIVEALPHSIRCHPFFVNSRRAFDLPAQAELNEKTLIFFGCSYMDSTFCELRALRRAAGRTFNTQHFNIIF
jgi:hypothetical protein